MNEAQRQTTADAYQAYNAMETTKRRHFGLLNAIENRRAKFNIDPSQEEQRLLGELLQDHDEQVSRFKSASDALREADAGAFTALWDYIGEINRTLAPFEQE